MITITRRQARRLRAVFRRHVGVHARQWQSDAAFNLLALDRIGMRDRAGFRQAVAFHQIGSPGDLAKAPGGFQR